MAGQERHCQHVNRHEVAGGSQVYDMLLVSLFFFVVLSPLAINAGLNVAERFALRRTAHEMAKKKDPRSAWAPDTSARAVSPAAPSAQ